MFFLNFGPRFYFPFVVEANLNPSAVSPLNVGPIRYMCGFSY